MLHTIAIRGYRSLREVVLPLRRLTVVTGANGTGKSSLYRALRLLADCGRGELVGSLAREGGLDSVLWAGPERLGGARRTGRVEGTTRTGPTALELGFASEDFGYLVDLGLPQMAGGSLFALDPEIKREVVFVLNEPETRLHPDLLSPLASLIATAANLTQVVVVVTHSRAMLEFLATTPVADVDDDTAAVEIPLYKALGETGIDGLGMLTAPPWDWGNR